MLSAKNLNFTYDKKVNVFSGSLNFDVLRNDRLLIDGDAGAGVTTLCRLLLGSLIPSEGSVCVEVDPVGVLDPVSCFKPEYSVKTNLELLKAYYGKSCVLAAKKIIKEAEMYGFNPLVPLRTLSGSDKKLLANIFLFSLAGGVLVVDFWPNSVRDPYVHERLWKHLDENFNSIILTSNCGKKNISPNKKLFL